MNFNCIATSTNLRDAAENFIQAVPVLSQKLLMHIHIIHLNHRKKKNEQNEYELTMEFYVTK